MRIFSWVQNKLNGKQEKKRFDPRLSSARYSHTTDARKEEFSDWPEGFLAIGTFGKKDQLKEEPENQDSTEESLSTEDLSQFTIEEVSKLGKELMKFLALKPKTSTEDGGHLPLHRFLNFPSSLEVDRTASRRSSEGEGDANNGDLSPKTKIIFNKARDILGDGGNGMKKRSLSFLLNKMFLCGSGFGLSPSLGDQMPESRMEKILRTMLRKKMYPQNPTPTSSKKYLEDKSINTKHAKEKMKKGEDMHQWVRTDSEYIVLEI